MYSKKKKKTTNLKGYKVKTKDGIKLGYVSHTKTNASKIDKIYVRNKVLFFYTGKTLIINNSQILKIKDKTITVADTKIKALSYSGI